METFRFTFGREEDIKRDSSRPQYKIRKISKEPRKKKDTGGLFTEGQL